MKKCKLVIGNGFDLYGGMQTTFMQYFESEIKQYCIKLDDSIKLFHSTFIKNEYDEGFKNDIKEIKDNLNIWDYILYKFGYKYNYWFDFENILHDFITKHLDYVCKYYSDIAAAKYERFHNPITYDDEYEYSLFSIAVAYGLFFGFDFGIYHQPFYDELIKFETKFGNYIDCQFESNINKLIEKTKPLFDSVKNVYDIASIDTFNYTPIENYEYFEKMTKFIYHINGSTKTHPIFGYDFDEKDKFSEKFSKTFRRIRSTDYCESYENNYPLMDEFDDLVIFGHSLCKMDYSYYFPIFNYLHILEPNYKNRIVIYYHNSDGVDRRNELVFSFTDMLKQYTIEMTGKSNPRLIDSLSIQGRLLFVSV